MRQISLRQFNREIQDGISEPVVITLRTTAGSINQLGTFYPATEVAGGIAVKSAPPAMERFNTRPFTAVPKKAK